MKVSVTGGSGFIGSHVVDKLKEKGYDVSVIDTKKPHRDDVEWQDVDITQTERFQSVLKGTDFLFHLAAVSNVNVAYEDPVGTVKLNSLATVNMLEAARRFDIKRVIFASTVWVYGSARDEQVYEDTPFYMPGPGHIYTSTKIASEMFLNDYAKLYNTPFTVLRYGVPYGPRARAGTIIPIFIKKALNNEALTIFGDGEQYRYFLYVEDLAEGNMLAMNDIAKNKIYNLDGKEKISVKKVAETIKELLNGNVEIVYEEARPGDFRGNIVSSVRAREELGWEPKTEFLAGMKKYIEWFKENKD